MSQDKEITVKENKKLDLKTSFATAIARHIFSHLHITHLKITPKKRGNWKLLTQYI